MSTITRGVIAAGHEATAAAGAEMFHKGGNAFDAVVAAAFASFVCEATLTSAGGGGFLTAYRRETDESLVLDFFVNMPGLANPQKALEENFFPIQVDFGSTHQEFHVGPASVAVPGNLAGLFEAHQRFGDLPFETVLAPAVRLARDGVVVNRYQAYFIALLEPILTHTEAGRTIFSPQGKLLGQGDRLIMKEFAQSLEEFGRSGPSRFYTGDLAEQSVAALSEYGGLLSLEDLKSYRVETRPPLAFDYRGYAILTNPPPSAGGCLIALCLKILEGVDFRPRDFLTPHALDAQIAAMQLTNAVRSRGYDQRLHQDDGLVLDLLAVERIRTLREQQRKLLSGESLAPTLADPSAGASSTTQISVLDGKGNAASLTASNGEGSGVFVPGTGIMLNNMLGEEDINPAGFHGHEPGRRISSMMSPTIVLKGGEPVAVLGSGGSNRIRTAIFQVFMNLADFKRDVHEAVNAPRIHWERDLLNIEPGIEAPIGDHLCPKDHRIYWKETNLFFGGVHAVTRDPATGVLAGAGDHRRGGATIAVA